jgi:hypothetical protein
MFGKAVVNIPVQLIQVYVVDRFVVNKLYLQL